MSSRLERIGDRWTDLVIRHAGKILLLGLVLTVLAALSASRFTLRTDFVELLPQDEPSIKDLEKAKQRKGGLSNMFVVVMGHDQAKNKQLADDLAARFAKLPSSFVMFMKYSINEERDFYSQHKHLYADLPDLQEIQRRLQEKIQYERIRNNPVLNMDLDGEAPQEPIGFDLSDIRAKYEKKTSSYNKFLDGYLTGEEGRVYAILLYPPGDSTGVDFGKKMLRAVKEATAEVCHGGPLPPLGDRDEIIETRCPERYDPSTRVGFAGGMVTSIEEQEAIVADLVLVTCICLFFVGLVVLLYFRVFRSIPVLGIPLLMGVTWTFGVSIYIVHHLNTSTAFLASIIVGNGINFGIIQFARFVEEMRAGKTLREALSKALVYTARSTSTASLAASIAYGSLIVTNFRGFNGFGYMGGIGMLLCWICAFTMQPAMVALLDRWFPFRKEKGSGALTEGMLARPFARFIFRYKNAVHALAIVFTAVCAVALVPYLAEPYEFNFNKLRNKVTTQSGSASVGRYVDRLFTQRLDPMFILVDRPDQVPLVVSEVKRSSAATESKGLFDEVVSIYSYLPKDQEAKIAVLRKIKKQLSKSTLSWMSDRDRAEVEKFLPPDDLRPLTIEDLPSSMSRIFTELDGRKGLVVAMYPQKKRSVYDGHFLMELDSASRSVQLPNGEVVNSAGVATIFADMLRAVQRDGPRAVAVSLLGVLILVLVVFKSLRQFLLIIGSLLLGIVWTLGPAAMMGMKLNFLNFIAIPITFGIGIDYAVNIFSRYRLDGPGSMEHAVASTGGAVALCALTTIIGYSSLLIADNQALVSFGWLANLGEFASLTSALVVLPTLVTRLEQRRARASAPVKGRAVGTVGTDPEL